MDLIQQILGADDLKHQPAEVPEWPHPETGEPLKLTIRKLSYAERLAFGVAWETEDPDNRLLLELAHCLGDESGNRIFTDDKAGMEILRKKNSNVLMRLYDLCDGVNYPPKALEQALKNS